MFHFPHNSYLSLSEAFYSKVRPAVFPDPEVVLRNTVLEKKLGIRFPEDKQAALIFSGNQLLPGSVPYSQAYAGHQFGYFTMLGDGRAAVLGEHVAPSGETCDIQLKGSGKTPYSRRGDGRATLKSMLREYLISEAMHHLGIPTSRSLAVVKTGEEVSRESINKGAVLTRVMKSHIRVGTFQYARSLDRVEELQALTHYTINRHFPELNESENPALQLLEKVIQLQVDLVIHWMRVGFIHGVMNKDNVAICGETFDYGPCAFMNSYNPDAVFSSIDQNGRYAFGNQPKVLKWNLARFAEALLPLVHDNKDKAIELLTDKIEAFDQTFTEKYQDMMCAKLGIYQPEAEDMSLLQELMDLMLEHQADYSNTFTGLGGQHLFDDNTAFKEALLPWKKKWMERLENKNGGMEAAKSLMKKMNPVFIPRNVHVEKALDAAAENDFSRFNALLKILADPYDYQEEMKNLLYTDTGFDQSYKTFCGT